MTPRSRKHMSIDTALTSALETGGLRFDAKTSRWHLASFQGARAMSADPSFRLRPVRAAEANGEAGAVGAIVHRGWHLQSLWHASHMRIRPVAATALKVSSMTALEPSIRDRARRLLDQAVATQSDDLEATFVLPLVGETLMDLFGVPPGRRAFVLHCGEVFGGFFNNGATPNEAAAAQALVGSFFSTLLESPCPEGAAVLRTVQAALARDALILDEAVTLLSDLLFGAMHTTPATLTFLLGHLTDPTLRQSIISGSIPIDGAVEEAARLRSAPYVQGRVSTRDLRIGGETIPTGTRFDLDYHQINRDPLRFTRPIAFEADRERAGEMAFGEGMHRCVGRHLARLILRVAAEAFLDATPDLPPDGLGRLATRVAPVLPDRTSAPG